MAVRKGTTSRTRAGVQRKASPRSARPVKAAVAGRQGSKAAPKSASKASVAARKTGGTSKTAITARIRKATAALAKEFPGWKIVETPAQQAGSMEDEFVKIDQGPSIADLKRKFLPDDVQDDADPFDADDGRLPVRIRPEQGGDAKTADIGPDGKITIVQG